MEPSLVIQPAGHHAMATFAYKSRCLSTQREAPQLSLFPRSTTGYSPPTAWLSRTALYLQNRKIIWIYLYLYTTGPFFCHQPYPLHTTLNLKSKKKKIWNRFMAVAERPATMKQSICRRSVSSYCTRRFSNLLVGGGGKKKVLFQPLLLFLFISVWPPASPDSFSFLQWINDSVRTSFWPYADNIPTAALICNFFSSLCALFSQNYKIEWGMTLRLLKATVA